MKQFKLHLLIKAIQLTFAIYDSSKISLPRRYSLKIFHKTHPSIAEIKFISLSTRERFYDTHCDIDIQLIISLARSEIARLVFAIVLIDQYPGLLSVFAQSVTLTFILRRREIYVILLENCLSWNTELVKLVNRGNVK